MNNGSFLHLSSSFWQGQPANVMDQSIATGPLVNVDGTPMLDDAIDAMGKVYGDSGSSFSDDGMFDAGMHGSDW